MMMFMIMLRLKETDQFLHGGVGEDPVEGGEGEGGEQANVDLVAPLTIEVASVINRNGLARAGSRFMTEG